MKRTAIGLGLAAFTFSLLSGLSANSQDAELETLDQQEQELPNLPRFQGPLTTMRPAALLMVGFDTDRDYKISRPEAEAGIKDAFKRADKNGNGKLSLFELEDWRLLALGTLDALPGNYSFDIDHDNQVSREEFEGSLTRLFDRHDSDQDNFVVHGELMQVLNLPKAKEPKKDRMSDRECADQLQRSRNRY